MESPYVRIVTINFIHSLALNGILRSNFTTFFNFKGNKKMESLKTKEKKIEETKKEAEEGEVPEGEEKP